MAKQYDPNSSVQKSFVDSNITEGGIAGSNFKTGGVRYTGWQPNSQGFFEARPGKDGSRTIPGEEGYLYIDTPLSSIYVSKKQWRSPEWTYAKQEGELENQNFLEELQLRDFLANIITRKIEWINDHEAFTKINNVIQTLSQYDFLKGSGVTRDQLTRLLDAEFAPVNLSGNMFTRYFVNNSTIFEEDSTLRFNGVIEFNNIQQISVNSSLDGSGGASLTFENPRDIMHISRDDILLAMSANPDLNVHYQHISDIDVANDGTSENVPDGKLQYYRGRFYNQRGLELASFYSAAAAAANDKVDQSVVNDYIDQARQTETILLNALQQYVNDIQFPVEVVNKVRSAFERRWKHSEFLKRGVSITVTSLTSLGSKDIAFDQEDKKQVQSIVSIDEINSLLNRVPNGTDTIKKAEKKLNELAKNINAFWINALENETDTMTEEQKERVQQSKQQRRMMQKLWEGKSIIEVYDRVYIWLTSPSKTWVELEYGRDVDNQAITETAVEVGGRAELKRLQQIARELVDISEQIKLLEGATNRLQAIADSNISTGLDTVQKNLERARKEKIELENERAELRTNLNRADENFESELYGEDESPKQKEVVRDPTTGKVKTVDAVDTDVATGAITPARNEFLDYQFGGLEEQQYQVFEGLVTNVSRTYSDGVFQLQVECKDVMSFLDRSRVMQTPALRDRVNDFKGILNDPIYRKWTGTGPAPEGFVEDSFLVNKWKQGSFVTYDHLVFDTVYDIIKRNQNSKVDEAQVKQDITAEAGNLRRPGKTSKRQQSKEISVSDGQQKIGALVTTLPFAKLDAANIISLLITGIPYNLETFIKNTIEKGESPLVERDGSLVYNSGTFIETVRKQLASVNEQLGEFRPFVEINTLLPQSRIITLSEVVEREENNFRTVMQEETDARKEKQVIDTYLEVAQTASGRVNVDTLETGIVTDLINKTSAKRAADIKLNTQEEEILSKYRTNFQLLQQLQVTKGYYKGLIEEIQPNYSDLSSTRQKILGNSKANFLVISDEYTSNKNIQAFQRLIAEGGNWSIWQSEYEFAKSICQRVAEVLDFEFYADANGNLRFKPPTYNRILKEHLDLDQLDTETVAVLTEQYFAEAGRVFALYLQMLRLLEEEIAHTSSLSRQTVEDAKREKNKLKSQKKETTIIDIKEGATPPDIQANKNMQEAKKERNEIKQQADDAENVFIVADNIKDKADLLQKEFNVLKDVFDTTASADASCLDSSYSGSQDRKKFLQNRERISSWLLNILHINPGKDLNFIKKQLANKVEGVGKEASWNSLIVANFKKAYKENVIEINKKGKLVSGNDSFKGTLVGLQYKDVNNKDRALKTSEQFKQIKDLRTAFEIKKGTVKQSELDKIRDLRKKYIRFDLIYGQAQTEYIIALFGGETEKVGGYDQIPLNGKIFESLSENEKQAKRAFIEKVNIKFSLLQSTISEKEDKLLALDSEVELKNGKVDPSTDTLIQQASSEQNTINNLMSDLISLANEQGAIYKEDAETARAEREQEEKERQQKQIELDKVISDEQGKAEKTKGKVKIEDIKGAVERINKESSYDKANKALTELSKALATEISKIRDKENLYERTVAYEALSKELDVILNTAREREEDFREAAQQLFDQLPSLFDEQRIHRISNAIVINESYTESPPDFTRLDVLAEPDLTDISQNVQTYYWAGGVDYDLWRNYGFNFTQISKAFLHSGKEAQSYCEALLGRQHAKVFSATITVRGDSKYRLGDCVYIEEENMYYYVSGISHSFSYGSSFETTLNLVYGRPPLRFIPHPFDVLGEITLRDEQEKIRKNILSRKSTKKPIREVEVVDDTVTKETDKVTKGEPSKKEGIQALYKKEQPKLTVSDAAERKVIYRISSLYRSDPGKIVVEKYDFDKIANTARHRDEKYIPIAQEGYKFERVGTTAEDMPGVWFVHLDNSNSSRSS